MVHTSTVCFLLLNNLFNSSQYLVDSDITITIYGDILYWGINSDHRKSYVKQSNIVLLSNSTMLAYVHWAKHNIYIFCIHWASSLEHSTAVWWKGVLKHCLTYKVLHPLRGVLTTESTFCPNSRLWCCNVTNEHIYSLPNCTQTISQKSFLLFAFSFFYFLSFLLFLFVSSLIFLLWVIDSEMRASNFKDFF